MPPVFTSVADADTGNYLHARLCVKASCFVPKTGLAVCFENLQYVSNFENKFHIFAMYFKFLSCAVWWNVLKICLFLKNGKTNGL